jgi:hypothetical protein
MTQPLYFISSCLLFDLAYTKFGQIQFVCGYLPSCYLRRIREQRSHVLPYPVRSHTDGLFCTFFSLEDAYGGNNAVPSVHHVIS